MLKREALNLIWAGLDQFANLHLVMAKKLALKQKVCQIAGCENVLDNENASPDPEVCKSCYSRIFGEPEEARPAVDLMAVRGPFVELEERRRLV